MARRLVLILIDIVQFTILARVILSFLPDLRYNRFADIVYKITDPIIVPCQTILYKIGLGNTMFDFSPIFAYFILRIIARLALIL